MALGRKYRTIGAISILSGLGILATIFFQIVAARSLTASEFAIFAGFLSLVNVAAVGSGALQNAVAVNTARSKSRSGDSRTNSAVWGVYRQDGSLVESIAFGVIGAAGAWILTLSAENVLHQHQVIAFAAVMTIPMSFALARQLGVLQGNERSTRVIAWSTATAIIRLAIFPTLMAAGAEPLFAVTSSVVVSIFLSSVGAAFSNQNSMKRPRNSPFARSTVVVTITVIGFAWLTNADVLFVSSSLNPTDASQYAIASVIIKTTLIVPGTMSLLFLARFAKSQDTERQRGEFAIEVISLASIAILAGILYFFGTPLMRVIFGDVYSFSPIYLLNLSLCFAPWVYLQAILIRANSLARWGTAVPVLLGAFAQVIIFTLALPDLTVMLFSNAVLGIVLCLWVKTSLIKLRQTGP